MSRRVCGPLVSYERRPHGRPKRGIRPLILLGSLAALMTGWSLTTRAQSVDTTTWGFSPGAKVLAIARSGNVIYLGGNFTSMGPFSGAGFPCEAQSGLPLPRFPRVVGEVDAVVGDGHGGWFIGGLFTAVDDRACTNLAHICHDGGIAAWAPRPNGRVRTIAIAGDRLFAGGEFDSMGGQPRAFMAAVGTLGDSVLAWRCDVDGIVSAAVVHDSMLYLGGNFTSAARQPRSYVAAVDVGSGELLPWIVALTARVSTLAIRDTTLLIGGYFWTVNGASHKCLVAVGAQTGAIHSWNPAVDRVRTPDWDGGPHVSALWFHGDSLFVGGAFSQIGGQVRWGLAEIDYGSAVATSWNPRAAQFEPEGPQISSLAASGDTLFVAGVFDSLAGIAGGSVAALSCATAGRFDWDPRPNAQVLTLAAQCGELYVGGNFSSVGTWVPRNGLAAIDATTGRVNDWDPSPNDYVTSLLVYGGKVYAGGFFTAIGGQPRNFLAAIDPASGQVTSWNPGADWGVWALAPLGSSVMAGGVFHTAGGSQRLGLAAIDTSTGLATGWDPEAGGNVFALAVSDSAVYVGGDFNSMSGQPRSSLAALDPASAQAKPWDPGSNAAVTALALINGAIYAGGYFNAISGTPRNHLAAIDRSGALLPWAPDPDGIVHTLAADDSTIFVGGNFLTVAGVSHPYAAALDARLGKCRDGFPSTDGPVWSLAVAPGLTYLGGDFETVGASPAICFAALAWSSGPPPTRLGLTLAQSAPNPTKATATIRYSLPMDEAVSLDVFDLQGRRVDTVLSKSWQTAGEHQVSIPTAGWASGCYLYRMEAGGSRATRKMVVVR